MQNNKPPIPSINSINGNPRGAISAGDSPQKKGMPPIPSSEERNKNKCPVAMKANNNRIKCDKPPVPQNNDDIIKLCSSNKDDLCKRFAKETSGEIICSNPVDKKDDDIISPGSSEKKGIGKNTSGNICKDTISNSEVEHHEGKSNQSTPTQLDSHTENAFKVEQDGMENNTKTSNPPIKQMKGADQTNDKQITQDNPTSKDKKKSKKKRKQNILVRPPRMTSAML